MYAPVFRFEVPGTHFATVVSHTSSSSPAFKVGEWVTVHYPAGHPEKAVIDSFGQLWLMDWAVGSFGALFFGVGVLTLVSGWRRNRRDLASPSPDSEVGIMRRQ
jgi:protein-S-isoprenylcysteine O-methyltransferase Ste14